MPSEMTESEAKVILESEYKFHGECSVFGEALTMAINALEKQEKIKEVFTHYAFSGNGLDVLNDCISALSEIKAILKEVE